MSLRRDKLPAKLLAFFGNNPDEELTPEQVATKFGAKYSTTRTAIETLEKLGFLECVRVVRIRSKGRAQQPVDLVVPEQ